jgi:transposase InsO family protein
VLWIQEANRSGARLNVACREVGISLRTYRRWYRNGTITTDKRPDAARPPPANKLTEAEQAKIIEVCNLAKYASLPPTQIVPALLDNDEYYGSESTFYRVLKANGQLHHRGRSITRKVSAQPTTYTATGPGQVFCWDITYLPSTVRGQFYYLYMLEDLFSRKIVGDEVHEQESGEYAAQLLEQTLLREKCLHSGVVLHSDNGAPMKSQTMRVKAYELGVTTSYSRPRVSNDNPFAESLFRTCKYRPDWPSTGFKSLEDARAWVLKFKRWYNYEHKHSKLRFVTPHQRHTGQDEEILAQRKAKLEAAKAADPMRWGKRDIRNCTPVGPTTLNPEKKLIKQAEKQAA